jgi:hypothetical protein
MNKLDTMVPDRKLSQGRLRKLDPERLDGYVMLVIGLAGTAMFASGINWLAYAVLFWVIDVLGYWPGVAATWITKKQRLPSAYTHLYNATHSNSGALVLTLAYALLAPNYVAAALAIPVHLGIDRGVFGNRLKRPEDPFL